MDLAQAHRRDRGVRAGPRRETVEHGCAFLGALDEQIECLQLVEIAVDEMFVADQHLGEFLNHGADMTQLAGDAMPVSPAALVDEYARLVERTSALYAT